MSITQSPSVHLTTYPSVYSKSLPPFTTTPAVPENLPSIPELKKKIANILNKDFHKSSSKAKAIVQRIPTEDPARLNKIYQNLVTIKANNENIYETFMKLLSFGYPHATGFLVIGSIFSCGILACMQCAQREGTSDERLTLRALMLYTLSAIDPSLKNERSDLYDSILDQTIMTSGFGVKRRNTKYLNNELKSVNLVKYPIQDKTMAETIPTIIDHLTRMQNID